MLEIILIVVFGYGGQAISSGSYVQPSLGVCQQQAGVLNNSNGTVDKRSKAPTFTTKAVCIETYNDHIPWELPIPH